MKQRFDTLASGIHCSMPDKYSAVVRDKEGLREVWEMARLDTNDLPEVDFEKRMVIAHFSGQYSLGGHTTSVDRIVQEDDTLTAIIGEYGPMKTALPAQVRPFVMVETAAYEGPVEFEYIGSKV